METIINSLVKASLVAPEAQLVLPVTLNGGRLALHILDYILEK